MNRGPPRERERSRARHGMRMKTQNAGNHFSDALIHRLLGRRAAHGLRAAALRARRRRDGVRVEGVLAPLEDDDGEDAEHLRGAVVTVAEL